MSLNFSRTVTTPKGYSGTPRNRQALLDKLYIGKVKDNRDVRSMGRLKVWIPEVSQDEQDENGWFLVSYCSPFAGATSVNSIENPDAGNENSFTSTQKSYGFWAVPPDLNVQVLVMFVNGDPAKGYWMGCIFDEQMNFMVPGIASDDNESLKAEYNRKIPGRGKSENPIRPTHTPLQTALINQGLENDTLRGLSSSSAKRRGDSGLNTGQSNKISHWHQPAKVYGMSTPGGHQLVLDDGWNTTDGSLIRFRTRNGSQILIDDSEGFIYVITKGGKAWVEVSEKGSGNIDLYSTTNVSIHAEKGNINLKAGQDINLQAGRDLNVRSDRDSKFVSKNDFHIKADNDMFQESSDEFHLLSSGNMFQTTGAELDILSTGETHMTGSAIHLNGPEAVSASSTVEPSGREVPGPSVLSNGTFTSGNDYSSSQNIIPRVPQHEPWSIHTKTDRVRTFATPTPDIPSETTLPSDATGRTEESNTVSSPIGSTTSVSDVVSTTPFGGTICDLTEAETQKFLDVIGNRESSGDYTVVNSFGYLGKYQMGTGALEDAGYIKKGTFASFSSAGLDPQDALDDTSNWNISGGKTTFLNTPTIQEDAMKKYSNANCSRLRSLGVISSTTSKNDRAGLIAAAHIGGVGGARALVLGQNRSDAFGGSTLEYFNLGSGSIDLV